jgi:hypothetical protein
MDYEKLSKGYYEQRQKNSLEEHLKYQKSLEKFPNGYENKREESTVTQEVDYSIIKMPSGTCVVARSRNLGSLDYDFVCECSSRHEAHEIVKALSK